MIFSKEQLLCDKQSFTTVEVSDNTIDLGVPGTVLNGPAALIRDVGPGLPVPVALALEGTAADTITVSIIKSANADLSSAVVVATGAPVVLDADGLGMSNLNFLPDEVNLRYLGMQVASSGAACVAHGGIVYAKQTNKTVAAAA